MVDITMCNNDNCKQRSKCKRHESSGTKPSKLWQSWARFNDNKEVNCDHFMPLKRKRFNHRGWR